MSTISSDHIKLKQQSCTVNKSLDKNTYEKMYQESIEQPDKFWADQARGFVTWQKEWDEVSNYDFKQGHIQWFTGAKLNVSVNCLDRHLLNDKDRVALYWEGDCGHRRQEMTYQALYEQVCTFANTLKKLKVKKGDVVCLYMPMIPQAIVAMLACARIGAVHSVVFAGFSAQALAHRIADAQCKFIITADDAIRGGKTIALKEQVDQALKIYPITAKILVVKNSGRKLNMQSRRDYWYHLVSRNVPKQCAPEWMDAEDPLFILYTSGSTGRPKGVLHTQGGYLLYAAMTHQYVFDYQKEDIYWCSADIGWITGHTYSVYGPLANGATSVIYEGVPTGPDPSLVWEMVDRYQVSIFYTAPTAIRALMAHGDKPLESSKRSSLRILGTVGEPINPEAWRWYAQKVGHNQCWIVDTWWQTETGGVMLVPLPNVGTQKPGSAGQPFFGVVPKVVDEQGKICGQMQKGALVLTRSWPGQMRTVYQDHARFMRTYFSQYPGQYFSGDSAYQDTQGDYWISGRMDDVINISGHRIDTAEVESALVLLPKVSEAAVIGVPHAIKGEGLYAFVSLNENEAWNESLETELKQQVAKVIGRFALPEVVQWAPSLPKTRSGKIMRRILRCIAQNNLDQLGDVSTLADSSVIAQLVEYAPHAKN
tara:strand:- start:13031 stop:14983 length:1953 start_codon:yes stop_codon:yes gene_type:complete